MIILLISDGEKMSDFTTIFFFFITYKDFKNDNYFHLIMWGKCEPISKINIDTLNCN